MANTKIWTVMLKMYEGYYEPRFAMHAEDEEDATRKARRWASYHSFSLTDVKVRIATQEEATNMLHDEYVATG